MPASAHNDSDTNRIQVGSDRSGELSGREMFNSRAFFLVLVALFVLVLILLTLHSTDLQQGWNYHPLSLRNIHHLPPIASTGSSDSKLQPNSSSPVSKPVHPSEGADIRTKVELQKPEQAFVALLLASNNKSSALPAHQLEDVMIERERYAAKHNYTFTFVDFNHVKTDLFGGAETPAVWLKLPAILQTMDMHPEAEWVWWLDQDAIIMNEEVDLYKYLLSENALMKAQKENEDDTDYRGRNGTLPIKRPIKISYSDVNLIVANDVNTMNAGSFFIRNCEWTRMLIDFWADRLLRKEYSTWFDEQGALFHMITEHAVIRNHTAFVNQNYFNAASYTWRPHDLAVHFAGCSYSKTCESLFWEFDEVKRTGRAPDLSEGLPVRWAREGMTSQSSKHQP